MGLVEAHFFHKTKRLGKLFLRLSRESGNEIRGQGRIVKIPPQKRTGCHIFLCGVMPVHPFQRLITTALQ